MPIARCHNPACPNTFYRPKGSKLKFCSAQCKSDADRVRRRIRDVLKAENNRLNQSARWWCQDCQAELPSAHLGEHDGCDVYLLAVDRRCRACGSPLGTDTPNDSYCGQSCFLTFWSAIFPGTAEDITHHPDYAVLNDLTGVIPQRDSTELFGAKNHGNHMVNLRKLHDEDQAADSGLARLSAGDPSFLP